MWQQQHADVDQPGDDQLSAAGEGLEGAGRVAGGGATRRRQVLQQLIHALQGGQQGRRHVGSRDTSKQAGGGKREEGGQHELLSTTGLAAYRQLPACLPARAPPTCLALLVGLRRRCHAAEHGQKAEHVGAQQQTCKQPAHRARQGSERALATKDAGKTEKNRR